MLVYEHNAIFDLMSKHKQTCTHTPTEDKWVMEDNKNKLNQESVVGLQEELRPNAEECAELWVFSLITLHRIKSKCWKNNRRLRVISL